MALIDILQDGVTEIDFVVQISNRDPDTNVESTVYLSRHGTVLSTGPSDTPANTTFPARVLSLGPIRESLSEDLLFSGASQFEIGDIVINNTPTSPGAGPYDSWLGLSFSGRSVVIKAGAQGAAYSTYETIASGVVRGEPVFSGNEISFSIQSAFSRLDIPLLVNRYSGNPSCLALISSSAAATAPYNAAYDLTSFTLAVAFRAAAIPSANVRLMAKFLATTNNNFMTRVLSGSGTVDFTLSIAGVDTNVNGPTVNYCDGKWHTSVLSVLGGQLAYSMIDGKVVRSITITGNPNTPNTSIQYIVRGSGTNRIDVQNGILISTYLTPDEARSLIATRLEGDETAVVALHRFDDGGGGVVNDYSPTNNDATISGTITTHYTWEPSDLGMIEQQGLPMPIVHGDVFNAPLTLIDSVLERHRWHDGRSSYLPTYNPVVTVKVRGVEIVEGVSWDHQPVGDESTGVIETTSEIDQPATFDTEVTTPGSYPSVILESLMVDRGGFNNAADIRLDWLDAMSYLLPSPSGVFVPGSSGSGLLSEHISRYLQGIVAHVRLDQSTGKFLFSHLLPPVGPGPVNNTDPVLEFVGNSDDGIDFGNIANPTGSMSLACWFKSHRGLQDSTSGLYSVVPLIDKQGSYELTIMSDGAIGFSITSVGSGTLFSPAFVVKPNTWYFLLATFDDTANTRNIFMSEIGKTLISIAGETGVVGSPSTNTNALTLGSRQSANLPLLGAMCHAQVWSKAHTLAQAQTLMDQFEAGTPLVGNEANLLFYAPINDGVGSTTVQNLVGPTTGSINYPPFGTALNRWAPQLTLDFTSAEPGGEITSLSRMIPAGDIEVRYAPNHSPLTQADISASVADDDAIPLKRPYLSTFLERKEVKDDHKQTRSILVESPFLNKSAAAYLLNLLSTRFGERNLQVSISGVSRNAMLLNATDEVRVISNHSELQSGVNFRVVGKSNSLDELSTNLTLALGKLA